MSLAEDLLAHARFLADLNAGSTTQASIRRSISAAYYAVFHLLAAEVAAQVSPEFPTGLRERTQRALLHTQMRKVARAFSQAAGRRAKDMPDDIELPDPVSNKLASIAAGFEELQDARHTADYDVLVRFESTDALTLVQRAENIFLDWKTERNSRNAPVFLAAMIFGKDWNK